MRLSGAVSSIAVLFLAGIVLFGVTTLIINPDVGRTASGPTTELKFAARLSIAASYQALSAPELNRIYAAATSTLPQTPPRTPVVPPGSCETGVSVAPCKPANQRLLLVAQDGSGQFNNIQAAINASLPGDTIQVKNGNYNISLTIPANKSGTQSLPLALVNYPGHSPRINANLSIMAEWVLVEGFEITQADYVLTLYRAYDQYANVWKAQHVTIRNNWIHDASYMGVYAEGLQDLLFDGNTFERNGLGPKNCVNDMWADHTAKGFGYGHCHGIYLGSSSGNPALARVTVRRNRFISNAGSGFQNRLDGTPGTNYLIENNVFINNQRAMNLSDLNNSTIRNNTIVQFDYPRPNSSDKSCFMINHIPNNIIANNACYLALNPVNETVWPITNFDSKDPQSGVKLSNNAFFGRPQTNWIWGNKNVKDFLTSYKPTTGDAFGVIKAIVNANGSEAGFVNAPAGDSHLLSSSPLVGSGNSTYCATTDFDGKSRTRGRCDIGAYGFGQ